MVSLCVETVVSGFEHFELFNLEKHFVQQNKDSNFFLVLANLSD